MAGTDPWFDELYRENVKDLNKFGKRVCPVVRDTEIYVHEAYEKMLAEQETLRNWPFDWSTGWLYLTLYNILRNEQRKIINRKTDLWSSGDLDTLAAPDTPGPLEFCLPHGLSPNEERILRLRFEENLRNFEIARILNKSEAACNTQLCRALKHCRELLEKQDEREKTSV